MPSKPTFAALLSHEIKRKHITMLGLAYRAGLSYNTVFYAARGRQIPRRGTRVLMAIALGKLPEFFEGKFSSEISD